MGGSVNGFYFSIYQINNMIKWRQL